MQLVSLEKKNLKVICVMFPISQFTKICKMEMEKAALTSNAFIVISMSIFELSIEVLTDFDVLEHTG